MKARIAFLHKTEKEWNRQNFIPNPGEMVIYDPDNNFKYQRIKIGDGIHSLQELPFFIDETISALWPKIINGGRLEELYPDKLS
jgi:hypothetical protein